MRLTTYSLVLTMVPSTLTPGFWRASHVESQQTTPFELEQVKTNAKLEVWRSKTSLEKQNLLAPKREATPLKTHSDPWKDEFGGVHRLFEKLFMYIISSIISISSAIIGSMMMCAVIRLIATGGVMHLYISVIVLIATILIFMISIIITTIITSMFNLFRIPSLELPLWRRTPSKRIG